MFSSLSSSFTGLIKKVKGEAHVHELNIAQSIHDIRRSLLDADVHYDVVMDFTRRVKEKMIGKDVLLKANPGQYFTKVLYDELVVTLGGETQKLTLVTKLPPHIIMVAGLQGAGKTTFCTKLAHWAKQKHKKSSLLVAADVYRPAAIEQLQQLGEKINTPVYSGEGKDPLIVCNEGREMALSLGIDLVILDTAGRLHVDDKMMKEIRLINKRLNPNNTVFVIDAMMGQDALSPAQAFQQSIDISGIAMTKLDGDSRGGAALSVAYVIKKPIFFASIGEKVDALEEFHPDRMANRILGMGDVVSLVEKVQQHVDTEQLKKLQQKIKKKNFTLNDFRSQLHSLSKMGNMKNLVDLIPGANVDKNSIDDKALFSVLAMCNSMTNYEREHPEVLNASRRRRIAYGSGVSIQKLNSMLNQYYQMKKIMIKAQQKGGKKKASRWMEQILKQSK